MNKIRRKYPYKIIDNRTGTEITHLTSFALTPEGILYSVGADDFEDDYSYCCRIEFCEPITEGDNK